MKIFYFDVETSGLDPAKHGILSIAYIIEVDGVVKRRESRNLQLFVGDEIDVDALKINGLDPNSSDSMNPHVFHVDLLSDMGSQCDKFDTSDKYFPCAYNGAFDMAFLKAFFEKVHDKYFGSWFNAKMLDPLPVIRFVHAFYPDAYPALLNHKLSSIASFYHIPIVAHNALSDVEALREIVSRLQAHIAPCEQWSNALSQRYTFQGDRIIFEDGTSYGLDEAVLMSEDLKLTNIDLQAIHAVKRVFDGLVTGDREVDIPKMIESSALDELSKQLNDK